MSTTAYSVLGTIRIALEKFNATWDSIGPARVKPLPEKEDGRLIVECDGNLYNVTAVRNFTPCQDVT